MPVHEIDNLDDARLAPYRDLRRSADQPGTRFVAEGDKLVRRLLASPCATESILCTRDTCAAWATELPPQIPVFLLTTSLISQLVGFRFHRGVLAVGSPPPPRTLAEFLKADDAEPALLAACPEIRDPENLGSIIRSAAALGARCLLLGPAGTAPFTRRVLRTSMGAVLQLPLVTCADWEGTIQALHASGFATIAAVLDQQAVPLSRAVRTGRTAVFFGNEDRGLPTDLTSSCRAQVRIPMSDQELSLNVGVAAGIILHHFSGQRNQA